MKAEVVLAFVFGAVFLVALLVLAVIFPCPTSFQLQVFQTIMALAAAGVAAVIPGLLEIKSQVRKFGLRAGGALAMFVLVYQTNPAIHLAKGLEVAPCLPTSVTHPDPKQIEQHTQGDKSPAVSGTQGDVTITIQEGRQGSDPLQVCCTAPVAAGATPGGHHRPTDGGLV